MYQTSLSYFIAMFDHCIDASDKAADVGSRLRLLTSFATRFIFDKVQRGLLEQHKLLFSFMLATATARAAGRVSQVPLPPPPPPALHCQTNLTSAPACLPACLACQGCLHNWSLV